MIGRTIARYKILQQVGTGGMGIVYQARDLRLDRLVALKILQPDRIGSEEQVRRVAQEARAASALNHPNIVTIYEIEVVPGGPDFIAMEFVEGRSLRSMIGQNLPPDAIYAIGRQVAEALAAASSQQRDRASGHQAGEHHAAH
jgi:serine/threonine protein kinase